MDVKDSYQCCCLTRLGDLQIGQAYQYTFEPVDAVVSDLGLEISPATYRLNAHTSPGEEATVSCIPLPEPRVYTEEKLPWRYAYRMVTPGKCLPLFGLLQSKWRRQRDTVGIPTGNPRKRSIHTKCTGWLHRLVEKRRREAGVRAAVLAHEDTD